ncbi:MAG: hypothetical protein ACI83O_000763 [Patescibacteria group bacterium]|jgi:hypothetical protein
MKREIIFLMAAMFMFSFVSAGFFGSSPITGNVVGSEGVTLEDLLTTEEVVGIEIPSGIPFTDEVFSVSLGDRFVGMIILEEKIVTEIYLDSRDDVTYNVILQNADVIDEISEAEDPVAMYNAKRASGEISVEAVGFVDTIKLSVIHFFSRWF